MSIAVEMCRSFLGSFRKVSIAFEKSVDRLSIVQKNIDRFVDRSNRVSIVSSENVAKMTGYCNPSVWQNLVGIQ